MIDQPILRIALPTPLRRLFDYLPPQSIENKRLTPGIRVSVPFQQRTLIGILVEVSNESDIAYEKLKKANAILDNEPIFSNDIYQLCQWASDYYHYPLGEVLIHALPTLLRKGKTTLSQKIKLNETSSVNQDALPELNVAQQDAINAILAARGFQPFLLDGVTGSGKTEVYLRIIDKVLASNQQVLVLVPEISLTPQTVARFRARFSHPLVSLHSNLSEQERLQAWLSARTGTVKIVIGTRSAIFTPFAELGLIIVDEEHDASFKQQERFRYHARDLAVMRANINRIPIVLGSATPSLESQLNVKKNRYAYLTLPNRAGLAQLPDYQLIDLRKNKVEEGLSQALLSIMQEHLEKNNQVLLFLNRRGFAPVLYCTECAWIVNCKACDARLVYHRTPLHLQCHHCNDKKNIPTSCVNCNSTSLMPIGLGTQRLETSLTKHFVNIPIIRVDRDNSRRRGAIEDLISQINQEKKAILLGTQMLAKGHHFPRVTLVGIADGDRGFFSTDFRAAEHLGQLLLQVAGRAGRADQKGTVLIQTRHPEHPLLQTLIQEGYSSFSEKLLIERKEAVLPPYAYFSIFRAEGRSENAVHQFLTKVKTLCEISRFEVSILGPVPAMIAKKRALYCQHLLLRASKRSVLQQFLKSTLPNIETLRTYAIKWVLDVDPIEV